MKKKLSLILFFLNFWIFAIAQNQEQSLRNIIKDANLPGLQLTYTFHGKVTKYAIGTGKENSMKPLTTATIFRAGSLGKCVFAYAIMKLYDRGVISLDTPLLNYVGSYNRFDANNPEFKKITARMVLSHTSGLSELQPLEKIKANLLFEPGSSFAYSGEGIWFLQKVVEKVLNKPIEQIMQEEVFRPLGMLNSTYVQNSTMDKDMLGEEPKNFAWLSPNAAFTMLTTADDYSCFLEALLNHTGLKPETQKLMLMKQTDARIFRKPASEADPYIDWGLGIGLQQNEKGTGIWQWGNYGDDFYSFFIAYPERKEALVFFTRGQSALKITDQVVSLMSGPQHLWAMRWLNIGYTYPETMAKLYDLLRWVSWSNTSKLFHKLKDEGYRFSQSDLEGYGHTLLRQKSYEHALQIFRQEVILFPESAGAYDSFAEAYAAAGKTKLAIKNYQYSLKLDSNNSNAQFRIKSLTYAPKLTSKLIKVITGKYVQLDNTNIFMLVSVKADRIVLTDNEGGILDLYQVGDAEFYNFDLQMRVQFIKDDTGKIKKALINNRLSWTKME